MEQNKAKTGMSILLETLVNIAKFLPILVLSTLPILLSLIIAGVFLGEGSPFLSTILICCAVYIFLPLSLRQAIYLFPYKFGKKKNYTLILLLIGFLFLGFKVSNTLFNLIQSEILIPCPEPYQDDWLTLAYISTPTFFVVVMIVISFLGFLFYRYGYKNNVISELDVLYLRTFSAHSDSYNSRLLTRLMRNRGNIGFVLPPKSMLSAWSPYLVWFSGNIILPFSNLPILFKENTLGWKFDMEKLITSARCIVIDVTQIGEGTEWEIDAIERLGCQHKTIVLTNESQDMNFERLAEANKVTVYSQRVSAFPHLALQKRKELEDLLDKVLEKQQIKKILETRYLKRDKALTSVILGAPILLYTFFYIKSYVFPSNMEQAIFFNNAERIKTLAAEGLADDLRECSLPHLVRAYESGNREVAELLLENGANPDIIFRKDGLLSSEESPLTRAVSNGDIEFVELLLKNGANPDLELEQSRFLDIKIDLFKNGLFDYSDKNSQQQDE